MRPFRLIVLAVVTMLVSTLTLDVRAAGAVAGPGPGRPVISTMATSEGPLAGGRVTILGRHLAGVRKVTFGGVRATALVLRGNRLSVTAPARQQSGRVPVRVQTRAGWSRVTKASYYTYLAAPRVSSVQPSSGFFDGGDRVTLSGTGFARATGVTFAGTTARIVSRSEAALTVIAPPGVLGEAAVRVASAGGTSAEPVHYEYVLPPDAQESQIAPADDVVQATGVLWVTGGNPVDGPEAGVLEPWVVGVSGAATLPRLGAYYYLPPGSAASPGGLAGRVTAVAAQRDGTVRLTIQPDDLTAIFESFEGAYAGPLGDPASNPAARRAGSRESKFGLQGSGPFDCSADDEDTQAAPIQSSLGFGLENIHISEEHQLGGFRTPSLDLALTADLVTRGSISATASVTCKIRTSWANANRKPFALPIPGLTVSFGPTATIAVEGSGTWSFEKRTKVTVAVSWTAGQAPSVTRVMREITNHTSASASIGVDASFGVSTQLAVLDRAGVELKVQAGFKGDITVSTPPPRACVGGEVYAKASVGLFLDLWVKRWTFDIADLRVVLARLEVCTDTAESLAQSNAPVITSLRMPDGQLGEEYDARLTTEDDRGGRWAADRMPAGLSLDPSDGSITGTPTGGVGERSFVVRFTDGEGRTAVATVRLYVFPARGLEGGDVQITLTWESEADLDLHVNDPWGEDIYFGDKYADSGGELDYDANAACREAQARPTENIHWPYGEAPDGRYDLTVVTFDDCGTDDLDWRLTARVNGDVVLDETGYGDSGEYRVYLEDGEVVRITYVDRVPVRQLRATKS